MNWHQKHVENRTFSERLADKIAEGMGSWRFIIIQTAFVIVWMGLNIVGIMYEWDKYPFILLNLLFSTQAAYAAPIIMMAQNRQNAKDRIKAEEDYNTNLAAKLEIEQLIKTINRLEVDKLDRIIRKLEEEKIELPSVDEAVMLEVAKKFCEINKFTGGFTPDEVSFVKGAEWQARRVLQQLEYLNLTEEEMEKLENIIEQLRKKNHE